MAVIFSFLTNMAHCQEEVAIRTTDTLAKDTSKINTSAKGNLSKSQLEKKLGIKISKDELTSVVKANAKDSAVLDMQRNKFYLYNGAHVTYQDMQLDAGKIIYNQANNMVTAQPLMDTFSAASRPSFTQGTDKFTYDTVQYNFKSKRLIGRNVRSQYGEGFMYSEQVKRNPDQSIYGKYSIYTTCSLDTPHFGIVARRIKVIPGHVIASGAANINIEGVPTPIFLPFGIFPISDKQRSGFVLPTYTIEQARGLGLMNGGYYFYLNQYADLLTQANIFTKGSWAVSALSNYKSIYHYQGSFLFAYAYNKTGETYEQGSSITKDFRLTWRHQTDPKAKPGEIFNASVDAGTSTYYANNSYDPNKVLQNQYSSNISFSKNWQGTPFSFTVSARHDQNTSNRSITFTLPDFNFNVSQFNPFQGKNSVGTHWYDKITTSYTFQALNRATFTDSTFSLNSLSFNNMQNGIVQKIPISASYTVLRFVQMSFSMNYDEYWLTDKAYYQYNHAENLIDTNESRGFYTSRDFNAGVQLSTRIYGMKMFKSGKIKGIRHVLTPNLGFTYKPDFGAAPFNYGYHTYLDTSKNQSYLSPFASSIIGYPSLGKQGAINFGFNNNLQMKVRSGKDTLTGYKNVTLIDGFSIATAYNLAADSFNWSPIAMSFRTNVLDKVNISAAANFDPYALNYNTGTDYRQTMLDKGEGLARFSNANLSLGSNFHSKPRNSNNNPSNSDEYNRLMRNNGYSNYVDFNIPWSLNVSYSLTLNNNWSPYSHTDTLVLSHFVQFSGDLSLTERLKIKISSGYNFDQHTLSITSIELYRDMHCWEMRIQTIPFGPLKNYNFTLNVKASVLQDLKLVRRRDYRDAAF